MGYTKSSGSQFPAANFTGRLGTDAANTMQTEAILKAGEIAYTSFDGAPHRWGDYTGGTSDPDGITTWYIGEYSRNNTFNSNWATVIGGFTHNSIKQLTLDTVVDTQSERECRIEAGNSYIVSPTGDLTLEAKLYTKLLPGFSVQDGGTLTVSVDPFLDLTP